MQNIAIIWLIASLIATIFVVAALMLSSRISQEEGVCEEYDEWEAPQVARNVYSQQVEP